MELINADISGIADSPHLLRQAAQELGVPKEFDISGLFVSVANSVLGPTADLIDRDLALEGMLSFLP